MPCPSLMKSASIRAISPAIHLAANLPPSTTGRTASIAILGRFAARSAPGGAGRRIALRRREAIRTSLGRAHFERPPGRDRPTGRLGAVERNQGTTGAADPRQHHLSWEHARLIGVWVQRQHEPRRRHAAAREYRDLRPGRRDQPRRRPGEELGLLPPARVDGGDLGLEASLEPEGHHPERRVVSGEHERPPPRALSRRARSGRWLRKRDHLAERFDARRVLVNPRRAKIPPAGRGGRGVEAALRECGDRCGRRPVGEGQERGLRIPAARLRDQPLP